MGYSGPLKGKNFASVAIGSIGGYMPPSGPAPIAPRSAPMPAPSAVRPPPPPSGGGSTMGMPRPMLPPPQQGGGMPMQMLQQLGQPPAPQPPPPLGAPQEIAQIPDPTIFDVGLRAEANPALGKRNPALEGLIYSKGRIY